MNTDLLKRLAAAGTPLELIAEVAGELGRLEGESAALERRRASDRERQAARRHVMSRDTADVTDNPTPNKSPPDPQKLTPDPCVRETRARDGYHRLPEGWRPAKPYPIPLQAKLDQWPPGALPDEIASFKRWAANAKNENGKGRKLDWDKALWNWLGRRHDEHYGRQRANGLGRHQPSDGLGPSARAALDVFGDEQPLAASH